ncbi:MAG: hypothetical protein WAV90_12040 [Gordonia amarae]
MNLTMMVPDAGTPSEAENPYGVKPLSHESLDRIEAESGFWTSSPQLQMICSVAHTRGVGRWALLGAVLANLVSWLPPYVMLTDRDGTQSIRSAGSLNLYVHLIAESGEGKSRVLNAAADIVEPNTDRYGAGGDEPHPDLLSGGTGEGLLKHFVGLAAAPTEPGAPPPAKGTGRQVMTQFTDVAVVQIDEVSTYLGELARVGSKTAGILTSLWSGQLTGSNTSGRESRTKLPAHAARVCVIMLAQPSLCSGLFTDALIAGGTPQRPIWLPGDDWTPCPVTEAPLGTRIAPMRDLWRALPPSYHPQTASPAPTSAMNGSPQVGGTAAPNPTAAPIMTLPPELQFPRPAESPVDAVWMSQPPAARAEFARLDAERAATKLSPLQKTELTLKQRQARKAEQIQRHMSFTQLKVAAAIGLLHGRSLTDEDWRLAGVLMRVNLGMLAYLWDEAEAVRVIAATDRGTDRGTERVAADKVVADAHEEELREILEIICRKLGQDVGPRKAGDHRWFDNRRQKLVPTARTIGQAEDRLRMDSEGVWYALDAQGNLKVPPRCGADTRRKAEQWAESQGVGVI